MFRNTSKQIINDDVIYVNINELHINGSSRFYVWVILGDLMKVLSWGSRQSI